MAAISKMIHKYTTVRQSTCIKHFIINVYEQSLNQFCQYNFFRYLILQKIISQKFAPIFSPLQNALDISIFFSAPKKKERKKERQKHGGTLVCLS